MNAYFWVESLVTGIAAIKWFYKVFVNSNKNLYLYNKNWNIRETLNGIEVFRHWVEFQTGTKQYSSEISGESIVM